MAETWMLVEVEDSGLTKAKILGDEVKLHYTVSPRQHVTLEERPIDDILKSAVTKGFELTYASSIYPGVPPWVWNKVETAILAALRQKYGINVRTFDVSIVPLNLLKKY